MSTVRGTTNLDREQYAWGHWTARQLRVAALFAVPAVLLFIVSSVTQGLTQHRALLLDVTAITLSGLTVVALTLSTQRGMLHRLKRQHFGPQTYVNGPITTLPKEYQTRSYRRAQKRLAELSAPFEGFDEAGHYKVAGGFTRVLKVNPIDMELRSGREREHLAKRFAYLLSTAAEPIIPILTGEPISFEQEATRLRGLTLSPQVNAQADDYADFLESLASYRRQVYVPCWGPDPESADQRAKTVAEQLARMGLDVQRPGPFEVARITALVSGGSVPYRNYPAAPIVKGA